MSRREPRASFAPFVWGGLFLFCGIVLLLQVSGILPWSLWGSLWQFWPILIIVAGLSFLIPRSKAWLMAIIVLAVVGGGIGIILAENGSGLSGDVIRAESYTVPVDSLAKADVTIDFSGGDIVIGEIPGTSPNLIEASPEVRNDRSTMEGAFIKVGDTGVLSLKAVNQQYWGGTGIRWKLDFTRELPLDLTVTCNAGRVSMDLQKLLVDRMGLDVNAGSGEITLPAYGGTATLDVHASVSNLDITVPTGVAARIQADSSVSIMRVDQQRFPRQGDYYISPDFDSASSRVILNVICDVGVVTVK